MRLIDEPGRAEIGEGRMLKTAGYTFAVCAIGTLAIAWSHTHRTPQTIQGPGDDFSRSHHGWPWPPFGVEVQRHVIRFYRRQLIIPRVIVSVPLRAQVPLSSTRRAAVSARRTFAYPTAMTTPRGKSKNVAQARLLGILMLKTLCQSQ